MYASVRMLVPFVLMSLGAACNGGPSPTASGPGSPTAAVYSGHGSYINPIDFSVSNGAVTGVHGMVSVNCVSAPSTVIEQSQFVDADNIRVGQNGDFSDDYHYKVGQGTWTLHVEGRLAGNGTATGYLSVHGVSCSTATDGWAAAVKGTALPGIPSQPPATPQAACSPEPCQNENGVTLSVQRAAPVTKSDDHSAKGVDVTFSVANTSSTGVGISNTFSNFTLHFGNGDTVDHSWDYFTDSNGQDVPCLRSSTVDVLPGQQVQNQHVCFLLPHDETGQQTSFVWEYAGPPFVVAIGTLQ